MANRMRIGALLGASLAFACSMAAHAASTNGGLGATHYNLSSLKANGHYDRFIVTWRPGSAEQANPALMQQSMGVALNRAGLMRATLGAQGRMQAPVQAAYGRRLAIGADLLRTSRKLDRNEAAALMSQIASNPAVLHVAPDVLRHPVSDIAAPANLRPATLQPSDPQYRDYQWDLKAPSGSATAFGDRDYGGSRVNAAWSLANGANGQGIVIAVLDTGITTHVDVNTQLAGAGYDFITDHLLSGRKQDGRKPGGWDAGDWTTSEPWKSMCTDEFDPPQPSSWHGTHVASTVGAERTNNGIGLAGIAYRARVLPIRVLGHCGGYDSDISDAIIWAAGGHVAGVPDNTHPARVINLSLGGYGQCTADDPMGQAIALANRRGATVVVAAGNDGDDVANYSPASCPGAVTVAATGITSRRAYYSNYGRGIDLAAPGGGIYAGDKNSGKQVSDGFIWQALNSGTTRPVANASSYAGYAGTSQATPHVSGTVALMQAARLARGLKLLSPAQVLDILKRTAATPKVKPDRLIGAGILDSYAAVSLAIAKAPSVSQATPLDNGVARTGQSGAKGSQVVYRIDVPAGAGRLSVHTSGGSGDVTLYLRHGAPATPEDYHCRSDHPGTTESVVLNHPAAGSWYVAVVGKTAYRGVSVQGSYTLLR
ncbi:S8 family peptidase [Frateuria terrea]|uniref:Serine protease n=1 Tax=Frateuria terrea TaxID=529704 RepID=A0A1H6XED5_9GAMM|nr:S8 family peptidase [Frateuria terrea]SEJ23250.1 serine protease [Frateuria terrea]SFP59026.1 serine protease [Frateuria terrea]